MATRAKSRRAVSRTRPKRSEAIGAVGEVRDNLADAIDRSVERRPYTTLALALGLGLLLGAMWAR